jgi:hypothetical protein
MNRSFIWPSWIRQEALLPPLGLMQTSFRPSGGGGGPSRVTIFACARNEELHQQKLINAVNASRFLLPVYKTLGSANFVGFLAFAGFLLSSSGIVDVAYVFNVSVSKSFFGTVSPMYYPARLVVATGLVSALETLYCLEFPNDMPSLWRKSFMTLLDVGRTLALPNQLSCGRLSGSLAAAIFHIAKALFQKKGGGQHKLSKKLRWEDVVVFLATVFADAPTVDLSLDFKSPSRVYA